ncbi:hypothetical protein SteCoe_13466 [Stentor coeruleus]|uniref:Dickkopf N-terminal cysteine-rich domain-containing protein n=1 Tax=Stentor coeruleus TaxID=5963 RepID=A0A1R2C890_9CILI|nr:hypothetical protein SteCoe_13466 [Stentor coeruleus]
MKYIIVLLALTLLINGQTTCPKYQCKLKTQKFTDNTCVVYSNNTYYVSPCKTGYCEVSFGSLNSTCISSTKTTYETNMYLPGAKCTINDDCLSGICSKTCQGISKGKTCNSTLDCNPGLYCLNSQCTELITTRLNCSNQYSCPYNSGCNVFNNASACIEYFSLEPGEIVGSCSENGMNLLCKSGYCGINGEVYVCTDEIESVSPRPYYCTLGSTCYSKIDQKIGVAFSQECLCGLNNLGTPHCNIFLGDYYGMKYKEKLIKWVRSDSVKNCNTYARIQPECMKDWMNINDYNEIMYYYYLFMYYPYVAEAEDCVLENYVQDFYEAKNDIDTDSFAEIHKLFISIVLIMWF